MMKRKYFFHIRNTVFTAIKDIILFNKIPPEINFHFIYLWVNKLKPKYLPLSIWHNSLLMSHIFKLFLNVNLISNNNFIIYNQIYYLIIRLLLLIKHGRIISWILGFFLNVPCKIIAACYIVGNMISPFLQVHTYLYFHFSVF